MKATIIATIAILVLASSVQSTSVFKQRKSNLAKLTSWKQLRKALAKVQSLHAEAQAKGEAHANVGAGGTAGAGSEGGQSSGDPKEDVIKVERELEAEKKKREENPNPQQLVLKHLHEQIAQEFQKIGLYSHPQFAKDFPPWKVLLAFVVRGAVNLVPAAFNGVLQATHNFGLESPPCSQEDFIIWVLSETYGVLKATLQIFELDDRKANQFRTKSDVQELLGALAAECRDQEGDISREAIEAYFQQTAPVVVDPNGKVEGRAEAKTGVELMLAKETQRRSASVLLRVVIHYYQELYIGIAESFVAFVYFQVKKNLKIQLDQAKIAAGLAQVFSPEWTQRALRSALNEFLQFRQVVDRERLRKAVCKASAPLCPPPQQGITTTAPVKGG